MTDSCKHGNEPCSSGHFTLKIETTWPSETMVSCHITVISLPWKCQISLNVS